MRGKLNSTSAYFEDVRADYNAARSSRYRRRRTGVGSVGRGADYHYRSEADYLKLIELARDMDRNDLVVGRLLDTATANTIMGGMDPDPKTGDEKVDAELAARWKDWAEDADQCDDQGEATWYELTRFAFRGMLADGDTIGAALADGQLQLFESHRVRTPRNTTKNVVHGVLLDDHRRRLQYWVTKDDISPMAPLTKVGDIAPIDVRDEDGYRQVFHLYNPKRSSQTRGVTGLAPIFDALGMFEDINFARLIQQQVVSCFAIFRKRNAGYQGRGDPQRGARSTETLDDGSTRSIEGIAPGMEIRGEPGEELEGFSPSVPNPEFFDHMKLILTLVGMNLGLPLILVLMDATATNFSGWRGAFEEAKKGFRDNQRRFVNRWGSPIYRHKVRQWGVDDPSLLKVPRPFGHSWKLPSWPYIEPLKDASADLLQQRNGLNSPRRIQANRGQDWDDVSTEIVDDNAMAIRKAARKAEELQGEGIDVHWRELISLPTPDGVSVAIGANTPEQTNG